MKNLLIVLAVVAVIAGINAVASEYLTCPKCNSAHCGGCY